MRFDPVLGSLTLMGYKIQLCDDFSSVDFIYLIPVFSRIVWINKLYDLIKRFSLTKVATEIGKKTFFSYHSNDC